LYQATTGSNQESLGFANHKKNQMPSNWAAACGRVLKSKTVSDKHLQSSSAPGWWQGFSSNI